MTGITGALIKLGTSLLLFTAVFFVAARKNPKVKIQPKWATPLIALVFAALNVCVYWALTPLLNLATFGAVAFFMPFIVNLMFLFATVRIFESKKWLVIQGLVATLWMSLLLTVTHGAIWFALDYLPNR